jgi:hypothetical protein
MEMFARKKMPLHLCMFKRNLLPEGIESLQEVLNEMEHCGVQNTLKVLAITKSKIDPKLIEIASNYTEDCNVDSMELKHIFNSRDAMIEVNALTVKELQLILKNVHGKIADLDLNVKHHLDCCSNDIFVTYRKNITCSSLRNVVFRFLHADFFSGERMRRFKMSETDICHRCGLTETFEHLIWECGESRKIWESLNTILIRRGITEELILTYRDLLEKPKNAATDTIIAKHLQAIIQIERPMGWNVQRSECIIADLMKTERYIGKKNNQLANFMKKWSNFV